MMICMVLSVALLAATDLGEIEAMIDRGELDAASAALDDADAPEALLARLRGAIALQRGELERAADHFERALDTYRGDPSTSLYLAHVYVELGRAGEAEALLPALDGLEVMAAPLVRAQVERALGRDESAYRILSVAAQRYPDSVAPLLELVALCAELGVRTELRRWLDRAVGRKTLSEDEALALVDAAYEDPKALPSLERLAARFPDSAELRGHLAHAYAAGGARHAAARLFESASRLGAPYAFEAADQYRTGGNLDAALRMNAQVSEPRRRLRQRLAILFSARRMGRVLALEPELRAAGLDGPDERYRIAYASYAVGNYQRALELARSLLDTEWRDSAQRLIDAVERLR